MILPQKSPVSNAVLIHYLPMDINTTKKKNTIWLRIENLKTFFIMNTVLKESILNVATEEAGIDQVDI